MFQIDPMPHEQTHPIPSCDVIFKYFKNTVKTFSRVMAEEAAKVMGEFGFCPTWGFIQPEPLEDLGQHLSWLIVSQLVRCFFPGEYFSPWTQLVEELEEVRADPETSVRYGRNTHLS